MRRTMDGVLTCRPSSPVFEVVHAVSWGSKKCPAAWVANRKPYGKAIFTPAKRARRTERAGKVLDPATERNGKALAKLGASIPSVKAPFELLAAHPFSWPRSGAPEHILQFWPESKAPCPEESDVQEHQRRAAVVAILVGIRNLKKREARCKVIASDSIVKKAVKVLVKSGGKWTPTLMRWSKQGGRGGKR